MSPGPIAPPWWRGPRNRWRLTLSPEDGRIAVEFEVDQDRVGKTWNVLIRKDGNVIWRGQEVTQAPSGSFTARKLKRNRAGYEVIVGRATNPATGEVCRGRANFSAQGDVRTPGSRMRPGRTGTGVMPDASRRFSMHSGTHSMRSGRGAAATGLTISLALAATLATATLATAQDGGSHTIGTASSEELGTYLVGPEGMTLYYFTRDVTPGVSVCNGPCAEAWPPLLVEEGDTLAAGEGVTGPLGIIERADGSKMAAYRGRPLYYWASDQKPGDTTGQGVGDVWFVATADGSMPPNPPAQTLAVATGDLGSYLVDASGMTVYLFTKDETPGQSVCTGDCLTAWPPVSVAAGNTVAAADSVTGVLGLIPAADGRMQVTYDGRPLYYFQGDTEPGQTNGQAVNGVWFVVAP